VGLLENAGPSLRFPKRLACCTSLVLSLSSLLTDDAPSIAVPSDVFKILKALFENTILALDKSEMLQLDGLELVHLICCDIQT